jgi:ribonuclease HI
MFEGYWRMSFDGACSSSGNGVGIVLMSPSKIMHPHAIRLEFSCTNNEAEYEALIQGMILAQEMKIEHLIVTGDSELVINQVTQRYKIKKERLKLYFKRVNELMESFSSFNISFIPRDKNHKADSLALVASLSNPDDIQRKMSFQVERAFRPSVPDNIEYLQVFENDEQLEIFLLNDDDDEDDHSSVVPKYCIQSESLFTKDDHAKNLLEEVSIRKVQETRKVNIGTDSSPKYVNLGVDCTTEEVDQYVSLFKEYIDVFAWTYDDLKAYDKTIFQHIIPLREEAKPVKKKIRMMNPKLKPLVKIELEKLKKAGIIYPIRHSDWLSNPVIVRKKTREIRMCVDFRDLNRASIKDNFPLPNMEFLLQQVTGSTCMSMLDGFSGYNQVLVAEEDREKTTFITPWETYAYARIPFGLKNVGATFQRAMDHAFSGLIGKFMADYQDDLTVHSKTRGDHIHHLRKVFERCRLYGVSLNPKKCLFVVTQGKLLGHIVCKEGIYIDPERVKAINELNPPTSKKGVQSFFGKINFVRRFVPDYASIVKSINLLLKKEQRFEWTTDTQEAFNNIKGEITTAPVLISPDFQRDFIIYSFSTETVVASVLTQKNTKGEELPISFMRKTLHDYELRYSELEKKALALVKVVAHFQTYILNSHVISYVPSSPVKMLLNQQLREGKWANWLEKIQEYDIEIKPLKSIKGQGLCKLIANGDSVDGMISISVGEPLVDSDWYKDIIFYLRSGQFPITMNSKE